MAVELLTTHKYAGKDNTLYADKYLPKYSDYGL